MEDKELKESTQYENLIGVKVEKNESTLIDFLGDDYIEPEIDTDFISQHWREMPEYSNPAQKPFAKIVVNLKTEEDFNTFVKLMEQPITHKTKSIWYPMKEKNVNRIWGWYEDEETA